MWVMVDIAEGDVGVVRPGQAVTVRSKAYPGREFKGKVGVVYPHLMKETRTARVRVELPNPDLALLPDMYADVILQQPIGPSVAVPDSAVMNTGTRSVVFIARGNGSFEPRQVTIGAKADGFYAIRSGVQAGERVVVDANFLVDSESRLKSALSQMKGRTP